MASGGTHSQLFLNLSFYVDPGSARHPSTVRALRNSGATIVYDPKDADILLVQSNTLSGQDHLRTWNAEKKVLHIDWVSKSLSEGRLLYETDNWGECIITEDPTMVFEEPEPIHNLPTPRITPVDAPPHHGTINGVPHSTPISNLRQVPLPPVVNANNVPLPVQQQIVQNPIALPQFGTQDPVMQQCLPATQQQVAQTPFSQPQFPQQSNMQQSSMQQPFPPAQQQMVQAPFSAPQFSQQINMQQPGIAFDSNVYAAVVMDILQRQSFLPPWNSTPPQNMLASFAYQNLMGSMQNPPMTQPPGLIPYAHDRSRSSSVLDPAPSLDQKPRIDVKGKGRAVHHESPSSSTPSRVSAGSLSANEIFTTDSGDPLAFYVAIDFKKRNECVSLIRKHGGEICSDMTAADFGVLSFRSKDFPVLLETVLSSGRTKAVKPSFVFDSVEQKVLLDASEYKFDPPPRKSAKKNLKPAPVSPVKSDAATRQIGTSQKVKVRMVKKEVVPKIESSPALPRLYSPSPSPPPESTRVRMNDKVYRYPEVEAQYTRQYVKVLLSRDHEMGYTAIANKLHEKLPHHSAKALSVYLMGTMRADIDEIRKRAGIAYRKAQYSQPHSEEPPTKRQKVKEADEAPPMGPAADSSGVDPTALEQDLNTLAHFFANGGDALTETDDEQDQHEKDAQVWARLTEQTRSKTGIPWETFYQKYHERFTELYEALVQAQEEEAPE